MKKIFDSKNWLTSLLVIGFMVALCCGMIGWWQYYAQEGKAISFWTSLYLTLQLLNLGGYPADIMRVPVWFDIARFLMPLVLATTLLRIFILLFRRQWDTIRIYYFRNHYIFCGYNELTRKLIRDIDKANKGEERKNKKIQVVIIDEVTEPDILDDQAFNSNVRLIKGKVTDESTLTRANIEHAKHILALALEDNINLTIAKNIKSLLSTKSSSAEQVKITIKLEDFYNLRMFKDFQGTEKDTDNETTKQIDFHAFDPEQLIASRIIDTYNPAKSGELLNEDAPAAHILIMGLGSLGQKLLVEAAHIYHFPNLLKLKVTLVDHAINEKMRAMKFMQPFLSDIIDIDLVEIEDLMQLKARFDTSDIQICFVTAPNDSECIQRSIQLRQFLFDRLKNEATPEIVAVLTTEDLQKDLLELTYNKKFFHKINVSANYVGSFLSRESIIDDRNEVDNKYAKNIHESWLNETQKEESRKTGNWDRLSDSEKDSNRYPARHYKHVKLPFLQKNNCNSLFDSEVNLSPIGIVLGKMEHNRWNAEKLLTGFVKGDANIPDIADRDIKNRLKYHYCLCPWDQLTLDDQLKDVRPTEYLLKKQQITL